MGWGLKAFSGEARKVGKTSEQNGHLVPEGEGSGAALRRVFCPRRDPRTPRTISLKDRRDTCPHTLALHKFWGTFKQPREAGDTLSRLGRKLLASQWDACFS